MGDFNIDVINTLKLTSLVKSGTCYTNVTYFSNITSKGIVTNRDFWKTMKPFLANKGCLDNIDIMLTDDN